MKRPIILIILFVFAGIGIFLRSPGVSAGEFDIDKDGFKSNYDEVEKSLDDFEKSREAARMTTYDPDEPIEGLGDRLLEDDQPLFSFEGDVILSHKFDMGTEFFYTKYKEPDLMENEGFMYGITGSYKAWAKNNTVFKLETGYSWGQVDYFSYDTGSKDDDDNSQFEIRLFGGREFFPGEAFVLTPYAGFGYRYLYNDGRGTTTTGHLGYERISNYYYIPLGVETVHKLKDGWSIETMLEFDFLINGRQESRLSGAVEGLSDVKNDQEDGIGARTSVKFIKNTDKIDFIVEPFFRYWKIEDSEIVPVEYRGSIVGFGYEPENYTVEYGGKFAIRF